MRVLFIYLFCCKEDFLNMFLKTHGGKGWEKVI